MTERVRRIEGEGVEIGPDTIRQEESVILRENTLLGGVTIINPGQGAYYLNPADPGQTVRISQAGMECLHLLAQGLSNRVIAATRSVKERTVRNIFTKYVFQPLHAEGREHALLQALRFGFLTREELGLVGIDLLQSVSTPRGTTVFEEEGARFTSATDANDVRTIDRIDLERLRLLAKGKNYAKIASEKGIDNQTVRNTFHARLFPTLGARNKTHAVVRALQMGFLRMDELGPVGIDLPEEQRRHFRRLK